MPSPRRIEKMNMLIKEELASFLDREIEFPHGMLVTVTRILTSPDGQYADVFITALGSTDTPERDALHILQSHVYDIQQALNRRLRTRPIPKIRFCIDQAELRREAVEKTLAETKQHDTVAK